MPGMTIHEFDILRSPEHDLSLPDSWDNLAKLVVRPNTVFISSPPCATFSRSRHRKPGPPPLRTAEFPRGFPWLKDKLYLEVQNANFLVDNTLRLAAAAAQVGNGFLIERPEDLGVAEDGSRPSAIWQWPEMLQLIACHSALTFAVFQCQYGADTSFRSFPRLTPSYLGFHARATIRGRFPAAAPIRVHMDRSSARTLLLVRGALLRQQPTPVSCAASSPSILSTRCVPQKGPRPRRQCLGPLCKAKLVPLTPLRSHP